MADTFGPLEFPAASQADGEAFSDPTLTRIGAYLKAVINANLGTLWAQVDPAGLPVKNVIQHDPQICGVNDTNLPALYLWRSQMREERETDEWYSDHAEISVIWLPAPATQDILRKRMPFINGVCKTILYAIVLGRHPSWVDAADTDPDASTLGSVLADLCGLLKPPKLTQAKPFLTKVQTEKETRSYPSALAHIETIELTDWDPSLRGEPAAHETIVDTLVTLQDPVIP
jgi:hypothetical protein